MKVASVAITIVTLRLDLLQAREQVSMDPSVFRFSV